MKKPLDVVDWLKYHVEWNDEASRDMGQKAIAVLTVAHGERAPRRRQSELSEDEIKKSKGRFT
jgi:hypothetical protein